MTLRKVELLTGISNLKFNGINQEVFYESKSECKAHVQ
jgi:hypothetical protein